MDWIEAGFFYGYQIMNIPIDLFGFTISLWEVFLFIIFGSLFIWFLKNIFNN